ncbi:hypothetical protein DFR79_106128 [Halanaerobium saccharolyticum]|jgi:hypothetical protein|uniref:Uncharacterized protein n=1 Tax=Halanaerobium saccharolyticum TaxID=43595 RepID=A0A4R6LW39_9FIRM|nr:hypothetical protein [Halanaerobium saccharolyticum]TDO92315.1 hypothetical protein DFR79_106128 [Halanaerobium saccharolyticum]
MAKEKKFALDVPETRIDEEKLTKYIRQIVREEVEKYFERKVPDFE